MALVFEGERALGVKVDVGRRVVCDRFGLPLVLFRREHDLEAAGGHRDERAERDIEWLFEVFGRSLQQERRRRAVRG